MLKTKEVSLTNDVLFKETLSNKNNIKFLEMLLEELLNYPTGFLSGKITFVQKEMEFAKTRFNDKTQRGDLVVVIDNKIMISLEMYKYFGDEAYRKSEMYLMRLYSSQLDSGEDYKKLKSYYQFNISEKIIKKIAKENDSLISMYPFGINGMGKDIRMYLVNLDFNKDAAYNESRLEKVLAFIKASTSEEREKIAKGDKILMDTNKWLYDFVNDEEIDKIFDKQKSNLADMKEWGEEIGKEKMIVSMYENGIDIAKISKIANLSVEEVQEIIDEAK